MDGDSRGYIHSGSVWKTSRDQKSSTHSPPRQQTTGRLTHAPPHRKPRKLRQSRSDKPPLSLRRKGHRVTKGKWPVECKPISQASPQLASHWGPENCKMLHLLWPLLLHRACGNPGPKCCVEVPPQGSCLPPMCRACGASEDHFPSQVSSLLEVAWAAAENWNWNTP